MSIAYLAPARRDPSPLRQRQLSKRTLPFADANSGLAAGPTACSHGFTSILPPGVKHETMKAGEEGELNDSVTPSWSETGESLKSPLRDPRPSYTEEQKFFIMWARIVQEKTWPEIERQFTEIWRERTKGGLTSVYYRIRKSWKLKDVLCADASSSQADRQAVADRAGHVSEEFLKIIGYGDETMDWMVSIVCLAC